MSRRLVLCLIALLLPLSANAAYSHKAELTAAQVVSTAGIEAACDPDKTYMAPSPICGEAKIDFDHLGKFARIRMLLQGRLVTEVNLHCASAGTDGALIARLVDEPQGKTFPGNLWETFRLEIDDLTTVMPGAACAGITNIDSIKAAARAGQLYLEAVGVDGRARGQFFPIRMVHQATAYASDDNIVGRDVQSLYKGPSVTLWFPPELNFVQYNWKYHSKPEGPPVPWGGFSLHCAPAGQVGPEIAQLRFEPNLTVKWLMPSGVSPSDPSSACGQPINTIASIYDAMLKDKLYVLFRTEENPDGDRRGQFWP